MTVKVEFLVQGIPANKATMEMEINEQSLLIDTLSSIDKVNGYVFDHSQLPGATFVVNKKVVTGDYVLQDGDHVMVIRTLGGG